MTLFSYTVCGFLTNIIGVSHIARLQRHSLTAGRDLSWFQVERPVACFDGAVVIQNLPWQSCAVKQERYAVCTLDKLVAVVNVNVQTVFMAVAEMLNYNMQAHVTFVRSSLIVRFIIICIAMSGGRFATNVA
jgi:hypothetical protein